MPDYSQYHFDKGEFTPTYAGSPLETVTQTNKELQDRHYKNIAEASALELALKKMQAEALPGARPYIAQQVGLVSEELQRMAEQGAENSTAKVMALRNAFLSDEGLIHAGQRAQDMARTQESIRKLTEQGKRPVYRQSELDALSNAPITVTDEKGNARINPLYAKSFNPYVSEYFDPTVDYKRIVDEIKPDAWIAQGLAPEKVVMFNNAKYKLENGEIDIPKFLSEARAAGITPEKVKGLKNRLFAAFKNTSSYQQQKDYFDKNDEAQKEDLMNYGLLGTYQQLDKHYHQISGGAGGAGKGTTPLPFTGNLLDRAVKQEAIQPKLPWSIGIKPMTGISDPIEARGLAVAKTLTNLDTTPITPVDSKDVKEQKQASRNMIDLVKAANEAIYGEMSTGTSEEEITKFIKDKPKEAQELVTTFLNDFYKDKLSNAYATPIVDAKALAMVDNLVKRNPASFNYYDEEGNKVPMQVNGEINPDWVELTGGNANAFNYGNTLDVYNSRAGVIQEDDAAAGLHTITVDGGKDQPTRTFYISDPASQRGPAKNANIIYNRTIQKPGVFTPVGNGIQARFLVGKQKEAAWLRHKDELIKAAANEGVPAEQREGWAQTQFMNNYNTLIEYKQGDKLILTTPAALGQASGELSYKR